MMVLPVDVSVGGTACGTRSLQPAARGRAVSGNTSIA
jgi:hypothetical protein